MSFLEDDAEMKRYSNGASSLETTACSQLVIGPLPRDSILGSGI